MFKIANHSDFKLSLPEGHRFPMEKYTLLPEQLLYEGTCSADNFFSPEQAAASIITRVHDENYYQDLANCTLNPKAVRKIGFPLTPELLIRERRIVQGTIEAALYALDYSIAANIAGGTHHAFNDRGEGFCIFNDNAVAAQYLLNHKIRHKILIIDLDVHQGNGTAHIFKDEKQVFTFSMHCGSNYPFHKEQSDWDIDLKAGIGDDEYISILKQALPVLLEKAAPDFIFYQCGVDILGTDKMGKLKCSINGCKERDRLVFETAKNNDIPIVFDMGGGYSPNISTIIEAHANTYRLAQEMFF